MLGVWEGLFLLSLVKLELGLFVLLGSSLIGGEVRFGGFVLLI